MRSLSSAERLTPARSNEALFERHLYTAGICDPDLLIRTSGEMRIVTFSSGKWLMRKFTTETLWPDFDRSFTALCSYQQRERRFGKV